MSDAVFWKHELFRELARQRELEAAAAGDLDRRQVQIERFVFVTAYMMRKLSEGVHLTEEVTESCWGITKFPCTVQPPHRRWFRVWETPGGRTWQPIEARYDLGKPSQDRLKFDRLCNYLIHHFAFELRTPESGAIEMLFNSDYTKDKWLFAMPLDHFKRVVEEVAHDEVHWVDMNVAEGKVVQRRRRPHDG